MIPVILLAFANDKQNSGAGYLRGLTLERNAIRDALMKAEENGLCQVLVEPDATIDRLFDIFQNPAFRDRIALFHYGGHAESYSLLLESASGGKATAHSEGLVAFLAKQKSLKLVFLNGCSSQKQSEELVTAGLPAVIGTSQSINDTIATGLATRFYKGLAAGMTIERAWTDSIDQTKTENKTTDASSLLVEGILGAPGESSFPWELYTGEGGALSKAWNLPEAANQPLFGLELPNSYYRKLPLTPYPGDRSFTRDAAAIFFGRGHDIRRLYTQLGKEQPIIIFSGKKGVGKSSLLTAGLAPRIETTHTVAHCILEDKNLSDCLSDTLDQVRSSIGLPKMPPKDKSDLAGKIDEIQKSISMASGVVKEILTKELEQLLSIDRMERLTFYDQWISIEEKTGLPLIVMLDELPGEEAEWIQWQELMSSLFDVKSPPNGKLIVSVDEECHEAFSGVLQSAQLPFADVFLRPLDFEGLKEAISGVTLSPGTKDFYRLQLESTTSFNFPETLAGDLLEGEPTLVAAYLQVILSALWKSAVSDNTQSPSITLKAYQQKIMSGKIIDAFLTKQLMRIKEWNQEAYQSGLALDLLYLHTSAHGKSNILDREKRLITYGDRTAIVDRLVRKCKDLFLLTSAHSRGTNLGHSILALVVIRHYSISLSPGQQAARILNGKTGEAVEPGKKPWLNETDLEVVERGVQGMRSLSAEENALLAFSREKKIQAQKDRKRNKVIRAVLIGVVMIFAALAGWKWWDANQKYLRSRSFELAFTAFETREVDNTIALGICLQAYSHLEKDSPFLVRQTLSDIFNRREDMPFYASKFQHRKRVNTAVFSPDGKQVLTASEDGFAILWDLKGQELFRLPHEIEVSMAAFSPNGQQILTLTRTHVSLWDSDGQLRHRDSIPETMTSLDSFSTDGMKIIPAYVDISASAYSAQVYKMRQEGREIIISPAENRMLEIHDDIITLFNEHGDKVKDSIASSILYASFSKSGKQFLTVNVMADNSIIKVWNEAGSFLHSFMCKGSEVKAVFSPDGKSILTASNDFSAKLWDFSHPFLHRLTRQSAAMSMVDFFPEGNTYVTASYDSTARIWDASGQQIYKLKHGDVVLSAIYSREGRRVLTASRDSTARIWTPSESRFISLRHRDEVTCAVFSHDGRFVLTSSIDSLVRIWKIDGTPVDSFHNSSEVSSVSFSPNDSLIIAISSDSAATLWNRNGDSLHVFRHPARIYSAAFSHDGQSLLTSCADSLVRQWSSKNYSLVLSLVHFEKPKIARFNIDGSRIVTAGKMVKVWDINGTLLDSMVHSQNVSSIDFSPDGLKILTTCFDKIAYLWDFQGELVARYSEHTEKINFGCFTQDGSHFLTASDDGYIMRWKTPQAIYVDLQDGPLYQLTEKEEQQYGIVSRNITQKFFYQVNKAVTDRLFLNKGK